MPRERDHRDLGVEVGEEADALEAEPAVPADAVLYLVNAAEDPEDAEAAGP